MRHTKHGRRAYEGDEEPERKRHRHEGRRSAHSTDRSGHSSRHRRSDRSDREDERRRRRQQQQRRHHRRSPSAAAVPPSPSSSRSRSPSSSSSRSSSAASTSTCDDDEHHLVVNPGDRITSRYKVMEVMGEGKFSRVVEAYDRRERRYVAVKIVRAIDRYTDSSSIEVDILQKIRVRDPRGDVPIVRYLGEFEYKRHVCLLFESCGMNLFDFLEKNRHIPYSLADVRHMMRQLLRALQFLHDEMGLIHTDLKPENMLFICSDYETAELTRETCAMPERFSYTTTRVPRCCDIKLIDLGNAVWSDSHRIHTSIIATRHYRSPETILGCGWSTPSDMWSVGCIVAELVTGDALFQTHHNREHLKMIERVLGPIPQWMRRSAQESSRKYFDEDGIVVFPEPGSHETTRYVDELRPLEEQMPRDCPQLLDLVRCLLDFDPQRRLTAAQALEHPFFTQGRD
eukprot:m51a1_g10851 putative serine threonine-protein kinase afc3-like (456) ;mRNA; f:12782-15534